mmetsp:Transcript_1617/g.5055  ORF Transcript_1617/g.5055 Transcript_1617/m.5055 type:complete len:320 (-) Transcript_1617:251-1210(-)
MLLRSVACSAGLGVDDPDPPESGTITTSVAAVSRPSPLWPLFATRTSTMRVSHISVRASVLASAAACADTASLGLGPKGLSPIGRAERRSRSRAAKWASRAERTASRDRGACSLRRGANSMRCSNTGMRSVVPRCTTNGPRSRKADRHASRTASAGTELPASPATASSTRLVELGALVKCTSVLGPRQPPRGSQAHTTKRQPATPLLSPSPSRMCRLPPERRTALVSARRAATHSRSRGGSAPTAASSTFETSRDSVAVSDKLQLALTRVRVGSTHPSTPRGTVRTTLNRLPATTMPSHTTASAPSSASAPGTATWPAL